MLKKTITYTNFNDETITEDFYFNISKTELARMELEHSTIQGEEVTGGWREMTQRIVESGRGKDIMEIFDSLLELSYGVRSEDGKRFFKSKEAFADFKSCGAYDVLFFELVTDAEAAATFINETVPKDIADAANDPDKPEASQLMAKLKAKTEAETVAKTETPVETTVTSPEEDPEYLEWLRQKNSN